MRSTSASMWRSKASTALSVSPRHKIKACGMVPVASMPARAAPCGVAHPAHPPMMAAYSIRALTSGWTCRAPKLTIGTPSAAATHSAAAVAHPVSLLSIPSSAVSYSPNCRYGAQIRNTTSCGSIQSPSSKLHTSASGPSTCRKRACASRKPQSRARCRANTSIATTGLSCSAARMSQLRRK